MRSSEQTPGSRADLDLHRGQLTRSPSRTLPEQKLCVLHDSSLIFFAAVHSLFHPETEGFLFG